jgi:hypothetical protein
MMSISWSFLGYICTHERFSRSPPQVFKESSTAKCRVQVDSKYDTASFCLTFMCPTSLGRMDL